MTKYMCRTRVFTRTLKKITPEEVFTRMKPKIKHFKLFWVPNVFSCTQREEIQAISFRKKGYSESSKTFQIDIPSQRQIETSKDIVLKEEIVFQRPKESQMEIDSETIPSPPSTVQRETNITPVDPGSPVDMFRDIAVGHKRPT
jgi:hypothetical protein